MVQTLVAAEIGIFFDPSSSDAGLTAVNRLLCVDHDASAVLGVAPPPALIGWTARRRVLGWQHGWSSEPGQMRFSEQIVTLCSSHDDLSTVQAMVERAVQRGWGSVCLKGSDSFLQRAKLTAQARGLQVKPVMVAA